MEDTSDTRPAAVTAFFTSLVRCETRLYNAVTDRLRSAHGLAASQFEFLQFIRDHQATRVGDLAAAFAVGVGATSKGIDRLEAHGWITRRPNPSNRRSSLLALTEAGLHLVTAAEITFAREVARHVTLALTPGDIGTLTRLLSALQATLEAGDIGLPTG